MMVNTTGGKGKVTDVASKGYGSHAIKVEHPDGTTRTYGFSERGLQFSEVRPIKEDGAGGAGAAPATATAGVAGTGSDNKTVPVSKTAQKKIRNSAIMAPRTLRGIM